MGNAFLSHIAAVDGIFHLIRVFESEEIVHVDDTVDPVRDMETIQNELCAKDLGVLSGVLDKEKDRIRKEKGKPKSAEVTVGEAFQEAYDICLKLLESNTPIQTCTDFNATHVDCIREWGLITTKPVIYIINLSQRQFIRKSSKWLPKIKDWVDTHGGGQIIPVSAEFEQNLFDLKDSPDQQKGTLRMLLLVF